MSREIKFRAWDIDEKAMVQLGNITDLLIEMPSRRQLEAWNYMQYTGLKDKNGVEIYEGDILRLGYDDEPTNLGEVQYRPESMSFAAFNGENWLRFAGQIGEEPTGYKWRNQLRTNGYICEVAEVIGNIYEHGHLLENESKK